MPQGEVRWFNKKKGYGFVQMQYEDRDIFLHHSEIIEEFIPEHNDKISFEIIDGEKGLKAKNITKVG